MFFDDHPRFLDTSETAATVDRLNLRHEAIITDNADVLLVASHDGRWSFAALQAGAAHGCSTCTTSRSKKTFNWLRLLDRYPLAEKVEHYRRRTRITVRAKERSR